MSGHFHMNDEEWINDQDEDILMLLSDEVKIKFTKFNNLSSIM